jgi:mannose-binding lectin 1
MRSQVPLLALALLTLAAAFDAPIKKFEYKFSFKPPYLSQKDGTVPFWEHTGSKLMPSDPYSNFKCSAPQDSF